MSVLALINTSIYVGQADLTGRSNKVELDATSDMQDKTTFGSGGWRERVGGLKDASASIEGFWDAADGTIVPIGSGLDDRIFADLGLTTAATFVPAGPGDGNPAYFMNAIRADYKPGAQVGELFAFSSAAQSNSTLVNGLTLLPPVAKTVSGTGTAWQLGAVPAGQRLYAALHVLSVSGTTPSMTCIIQGDNGSGFPSPVTALSFAAATTPGSQFLSVLGPNTDNWYRVSFTISGTTPSFLAVVVAGIGN